MDEESTKSSWCAFFLIKGSSSGHLCDNGLTEHLWKVQVTTKVGLVKWLLLKLEVLSSVFFSALNFYIQWSVFLDSNIVQICKSHVVLKSIQILLVLDYKIWPKISVALHKDKVISSCLGWKAIDFHQWLRNPVYQWM